MIAPKRTLLVTLTASFFVCLNGQLPHLDDERELLLNHSTIEQLLKSHNNPFMPELEGFWSFNDTADIAKYEEFDHTRFEGTRELSLDELLTKIKERAKIKAAQAAQAARGSVKKKPTEPPEVMPVFDTSLMTNSTAQLGGTAYLHCRIRNLNNRAVSWVRRRDWHILTSALFTYTNDERFQVLHTEGSEDWILQIKYVQKRDDGAYECQVATSRGTISHYFNLNVVIPSANIVGTGEYHIGQGSTISLVCIIENSPNPPQYVMWYHNDKMINYDNTAIPSSGGAAATGGDSSTTRIVQVVTETAESGDKTHSRLLITDATSAHSGNYSCRASNTEPDSVYVFVSTDGDNIAAIQRQGASADVRPNILAVLLSVPFSTLVMLHW